LTKDPNTYIGEKTAPLTNGAEKKFLSICRRLKLYPYLSPCAKSIENGSKIRM
jgi:hypothetical protein